MNFRKYIFTKIFHKLKDHDHYVCARNGPRLV